MAFSFFVILLLLNLLIAVMTEAYEDIKENASARWCYVQMQMLVEIQGEEATTRNEKTGKGGEGAGPSRVRGWCRCCCPKAARAAIPKADDKCYKPVGDTDEQAVGLEAVDV